MPIQILLPGAWERCLAISNGGVGWVAMVELLLRRPSPGTSLRIRFSEYMTVSVVPWVLRHDQHFSISFVRTYPTACFRPVVELESASPRSIPAPGLHVVAPD